MGAYLYVRTFTVTKNVRPKEIFPTFSAILAK
jgi:hypothetical protein